MSDKPHDAGPPVQLWTRDGFQGAMSDVTRPTYAPDYLSVQGPHAPRRAIVAPLPPENRADTEALPTPAAASRLGVNLLVPGRRKPIPYVVRNVEADEI